MPTMSLVKEEFHVVAHCPTCGVPAEAWPDVVPRVDRHDPGTTILDEEISLDCDECGESFLVTIRAYPGGWEVYLTDFPAQKGEFEHYDYTWEEEPEPEPGAYAIFEAALKEWRMLVVVWANEKTGDSSENRMLFTQLYAIVEAYLSDAITSLAVSDAAVQAKMIKVLPVLVDKVVSLETIARNPNIVRDIVAGALQDISFHHLTNVNGMCLAALGAPLLPEKAEDRAVLVKSIPIRHDCVHRNGRDKKGRRHDTITHVYLNQLGRLFGDMAKHLDARIQQMNVERHFQDADANKGIFDDKG